MIKRLILIFAIIVFLPMNCWAVTYYAVNAGGNWSSANTWSTTAAKDATRTGGAGVPTTSIDIVLDDYSGAVTIDAASSAKTLDCTGYATTLTHNAFVLTVAGSVTFPASGMTYTPLATSTITISATGTLTSGGLLLPLLSITGGNFTVGDNLAFMASKVITLTVGGTAFDMNGKVISGNSATNRLLIRSATLGTAKTVTCTADNQFANCDFRDITFSSAASRDFSGITGLSGDCGGNTITGGGTTLAFTTTSTQTLTGSSASWSTASWTSHVPLPQDTVVISLTAGQTLTVDMPRLGKDISFTTATNFTLGNAVTSYGSLDFTNAGTLAGGYNWTFEGRNATYFLNSAGKTWSATFPVITLNMINGVMSLASACTYQGNFTITNGGLLTNGYSMSGNALLLSATNTSIINITNSTLTVSGSGNAWFANTPSTSTFIATGSTINLTNTSSGQLTFQGSGFTYNNVTITGGGTGGVLVAGSNTFTGTFTVNAPKTVTFTGSTTQQIANFVATGTAENIITLNSSIPGTAATLNKTGGGTIQCNYLNITDINVTPANTWYYGGNSTWNSGTGWKSGSPCQIYGGDD